MKIDFANLQLQYQTLKEKIDRNIQTVLNKSNYILGEEVQFLNISYKSLQVQNMLSHVHQVQMHCCLLLWQSILSRAMR